MLFLPDYKGESNHVNNEQPHYDINELADKWLKGTITPQEKAYYEKWYSDFDDLQAHLPMGAGESAQEIGDRIYSGLAQRLQNEQKPEIKRLFTIRQIAAAASVVICIAVGGYFLLHKKPARQFARNELHDLSPGNNKAILTLANGKKIVLDNALDGTIALQGAAQIRKTGSGQLVYARAGKPLTAQTEETRMNTLEVPRGGQLHIVLSDGTQVWLNSATTLKYPSLFKGKDRRVELSGEAYFQVAHLAAMQFNVVANGQTVEDIGTHFNINAYGDEPVVKTTLIEGSIRVSGGTQSEILKPGQQTIMGQDHKIQLVKDADLDDVLAWKDNIFRFNNEDLGSIMRKISRWYDVDVEYTDPSIKNLRFGGMITRYATASKVLRMLELTNELHFKIVGTDASQGNGKKIIVMK